eukprot:jgi/Tetstr1/461035/TSEL_006185.t1
MAYACLSATTGHPQARFNQGVSFNDATPAQLKFLTAELRRFTAAGAWEKSSCAWWVSRAFFDPKPGDNQWCFIIDLRVLNTFCARKRLRMETLMGVRRLTAKGDYMFSFDLQDGFYAMGIASPTAITSRGSRAKPSNCCSVRPATHARWLPVRELQSLAGRAQYLFLAIPAARFYLRELHDVMGSKLEARGFWGAADERHHITWKELKAVRLAVESFLPHLAGRRVLLHEDNHAVCSVLAGLTSRSPAMMAELRKLWYLLDSNCVHIRARYIRSAANVWADRLSRHLDSDDWQLDPVMFAELEAMWGAHSVDRFASAMSAMLPRYNAAWLDPGCEALDSLHLSDAEWRRENNYCNPPWPLLPDLVQKLRERGAAATVVAPRWEGKLWHHALTEMAVAERVVLPRRDLWLRGTVKAASLQPYLSAINGFYRDHGAEPVAQGDLISKVRKGLAASQVEPDPPGVRTDVPARFITRTLRLAETLREELGPTWTRDQLPRILLFHAAMAVVAMYVFYARGKAGESLPNGRFDVYCGQRGLLAARWAVTHDEPAASWTSATVTDWLKLVAHMLEEHPPPGFVWTSHSLRKGAAIAAYAIGVVLQKIKHFGGWAQLSSVVLDYINSTALPCAASWQLFGWLTPWGGPPATGCPPMHGRHDGKCGPTMVEWSYW